MIMRDIDKFMYVARREGWRNAARRAVSRLTTKVPSVIQGKRDVISHYQFLLGEEQGSGLEVARKNIQDGSMTWVIPDFQAASGGHINIMRMMKLLKEREFPIQHVVIIEPHRWSSVEEAQTALNNFFGSHGITVSLGVKSIEPCQYLIATGWQTAYWVRKYRDTIHRLYFVQDFEPVFYAQGSESTFAENTYRLGLTGITAGSWLAKKLGEEYGMKTFSYSFACDVDHYKPHPKRPSGTKHIFFYARPVTPRRCFEMGLLALKQVCERRPDVAVIFAGWDVSGYVIPFRHLNAGSISIDELPDLYSQCDVALVLSSTNLSLLPLEMAACGCPLVVNRGPQADWLLSADEALYCDLTVEGIAAALDNVLDRPMDASTRAAAALQHARTSSWEYEADKIAHFLKSL